MIILRDQLPEYHNQEREGTYCTLLIHYLLISLIYLSLSLSLPLSLPLPLSPLLSLSLPLSLSPSLPPSLPPFLSPSLYPLPLSPLPLSPLPLPLRIFTSFDVSVYVLSNTTLNLFFEENKVSIPPPL